MYVSTSRSFQLSTNDCQSSSGPNGARISRMSRPCTKAKPSRSIDDWRELAAIIAVLPTMLHFLLRRLLLTIPVLLGVATLVFSLHPSRAGGSGRRRCSARARRRRKSRRVRTQLGLDRPLYVQYWTFLKGVGAGRSRRLAPHERAGRAGDRHSDARDDRAGDRGDVSGDRRRDPAGHHRRGRRRNHRRLRGHNAGARRNLHTEFLARAAARDCVCRHARVAAGLGQRDARRISCCRRSRSARRWEPCWRG